MPTRVLTPLFLTVRSLRWVSQAECIIVTCHRIKRPLRDACLCMGDLKAPAAPTAPHFVFLMTL